MGRWRKLVLPTSFFSSEKKRRLREMEARGKRAQKSVKMKRTTKEELAELREK